MRFRNLILIAVLCAFTATSAYAIPMGQVRARKGYWGIAVEASADRRQTEWMSEPKRKTEVRNTYGITRLSYGLGDGMELSFLIGVANLDFTREVGVFNSREETFNGDGQVGWGFKYGGILADGKHFQLAGIASFFRHADHNGPGIGFLNSDNVDYQEYNFGLHYQYKSNKISPYLGIKYSDGRLDYDVFQGRKGEGRDVSVKQLGLYGGVWFNLIKGWSGFGEARYGDETSFGGGISYNFEIPWKKGSSKTSGGYR
ncbi:MAG: hypothetical protein JKX97_02310 [Candidatus Lindowbacteria bacterium]|nr:hypothetical protein [Candidatus Lindowbacteria bacterium]